MEKRVSQAHHTHRRQDLYCRVLSDTPDADLLGVPRFDYQFDLIEEGVDESFLSSLIPIVNEEFTELSGFILFAIYAEEYSYAVISKESVQRDRVESVLLDGLVKLSSCFDWLRTFLLYGCVGVSYFLRSSRE